MTALAQQVRKKALSLKAEERVELAEALLASVGEFTTTEIEGVWRTEVGRRVGEIESSRAKLVSSSEVHRKAHAAIDEVRRLSRRG